MYWIQEEEKYYKDIPGVRSYPSAARRLRKRSCQDGCRVNGQRGLEDDQATSGTPCGESWTSSECARGGGCINVRGIEHYSDDQTQRIKIQQQAPAPNPLRAEMRHDGSGGTSKMGPPMWTDSQQAKQQGRLGDDPTLAKDQNMRAALCWLTCSARAETMDRTAKTEGLTHQL